MKMLVLKTVMLLILAAALIAGLSILASPPASGRAIGGEGLLIPAIPSSVLMLYIARKGKAQ